MARLITGKTSSLVIIPTAGVVVFTSYPVPLERVRDTVSSGSALVSAVGLTITVAVSDLARNVMLVDLTCCCHVRNLRSNLVLHSIKEMLS